MTTLTAETRSFSLHPLAIHTFIKAQAGSLGKALSEAVMNAADAFASNVHIKLHSRGFSIEDDGQGFRSREEIAAWFETLGFPHEEGNHRTFGTFGMGRAQMWAYASTVWTSNQFRMNVDVQTRGLDYELEETSEPFRGTRIEGRFYKPLDTHQLGRVMEELRELVRYAPVIVSYNDTLLSKTPQTEEWDLETDEAYMRVDGKAYGLKVYNGGIFVASFAKYRFGVTGVVVTKPSATLKLNLARNDVLEAECPVWPKVLKALNTLKSAPAKKPANEKASERTLLEAAAQVAQGGTTLEAALKQYPHLLTNVLGRVVSFDELCSWRARPVTVTEKGDVFGKRLASTKRATVLSRESVARFEAAGLNLAGIKDKLLAELGTQSYRASMRQRLEDLAWSEDAHVAFPDVADERVVLKNSELDAAAKLTKAAWTNTWGQLRREIAKALPADAAKRLCDAAGVSLGDSPTRRAWLLERDRLVLRRDDAVKALASPPAELTRYLCDVLQELLAESAETEEQAKAQFIEVLTNTQAIGRATLGLAYRYVADAPANDLPVRRELLSTLQLVTDDTPDPV